MGTNLLQIVFLFSDCFVQVWQQFLHRLSSDIVAWQFAIAEQPRLNPRACWVSSGPNQMDWNQKLLMCYTDSNTKTVCVFRNGSRSGLLSPTFNFPTTGGDGQSLQRHRSTSTPNVHMVSTVDITNVVIIEVSFVWTVLLYIKAMCILNWPTFNVLLSNVFRKHWNTTR